MWNNLYITCPSDDICEYPPEEEKITEELQDLVTVLSTCANTLTCDSPLWDELNILKNIQGKFKLMFHCDKCLVYLHRVGQCIKKMVFLNLSKLYLDLAEKFLFQFQDSSLKVTLYLPSQQQLEFVLIRTITASKLVCEGIKYTRETFCFLIKKFKIGHLISDMLMAASIIARLHVLLEASLEQLVSMYQQLLPWRNKLKTGTFEWQKELSFPQDLREWLKSFDSKISEPFPMSIGEIDSLSKIMQFNNKNNVDSHSESAIVYNNVQQLSRSSSVEELDVNDIDYGEVIPRKTIKKNDRLTPLKNCKEVKPRKTIKKNERLTPLQKTLLQRILQVKSLKDLEKLWYDIRGYHAEHFPQLLTSDKKERLNNLFSQIRKTVTEKRFNRTFEKVGPVIKHAHGLFCKRLGFTPEDIEKCKSDLENSKAKLMPVRTIKELRDLYNDLLKILKSTNELKKLKQLKIFFKQRRGDIKLLKQNGEKTAARKLIFCTSKLLLTMYVK